MFRNLSPTALGLSCRQSELIELTLTHKFGGFDLDLADFQSEIREKGIDSAARFLSSARVQFNGTALPLDLSSVDAKFQAELELERPLFDGLQRLGVKVIQATIESSHPQRPYHENFEFHRTRLQKLGDYLAERDMRLGLSFIPATTDRQRVGQPFISKAEEVFMLLQLVDHHAIGMVVDLWDWMIGGTSWERLSQLTASQITEVRLADFPQGIDPSSAATSDRAFPFASNTVDCVGALTRLAEMDYQGAVTIAPHPRQTEGSRAEIVARVMETYDRLYSAAGLDRRGRLSAATI